MLKQHTQISDVRGNLVAFEGGIDVPFEIKRVFYIFGVPKGHERGHHAHYKTKQYIVAIAGSCKLTLKDAVGEITYCIDKPNVGIFQNSMVWGFMHDFSSDCVLLVMANQQYDRMDYIEDYNVYERLLRK